MKKLATWILVICLLLTLAACGGKTEPAAAGTDAGKTEDATVSEQKPASEPAQEPAQEQTAQPEVYVIIAYTVGENKFEGEQLKQFNLDTTELILNADHTGKLNLQGAEMDIGWTEEGDITVAGQPLYSITRVDESTLILHVYETEFTMQKTGAQPQSQPETAEATEEQQGEPAEEPTEEPAQAPAAEAKTAAEPYGDSDGVIDHDKLTALYHWLSSMQFEFRKLLTFDEIGAAVGKAGCDKQNGDGKHHGAYWTDGSYSVAVTFDEKDGKWTCGSISTGLSKDEYEAADISAFPKIGSSAPAGSSPVSAVTLENKCSGKTIAVTAEVPEQHWFAYRGSFDLRYYCAPNEEQAKNSYSYIMIEFFESEEKINGNIETYENAEELAARTIGGVGMKGVRYQRYGMDWVEYYGSLADDVWASIKLTGVDLSAGTETDALVNSLTFAVQ